MSLSGTYTLTVSASGETIVGSLAKTSSQSIESVNETLPVGHAGALTTTTITLVAGHGLGDGAHTMDVHWAGGCRYGCTVTITTNSGAVTGGAGDSLPGTAATPVVVTAAVVLDVTFDGDNLVLIGVGASRQTSVRFIDGGSAVLAHLLLVAGSAWGWAADMAVANPLTGNAVVTIEVSNGSYEYTSALKIAGLQYAA